MAGADTPETSSDARSVLFAAGRSGWDFDTGMAKPTAIAVIVEETEKVLSELSKVESRNLRDLMLVAGVPDLDAANLSGEDLSGQDLSGLSFVGADFSGSDLTGADLSKCNLAGAKFHRAKTDGINLSDANLEGATGLAGSSEIAGSVVSLGLAAIETLGWLTLQRLFRKSAAGQVPSRERIEPVVEEHAE